MKPVHLFEQVFLCLKITLEFHFQVTQKRISLIYN